MLDRGGYASKGEEGVYVLPYVTRIYATYIGDPNGTHKGWDTIEKLALAALDQGNLEVADVRVLPSQTRLSRHFAHTRNK